MGRFTKIFLKNEEQLEEYKKYYDFAMEIYQACPKLDNNFMANNFSQVRSKK